MSNPPESPVDRLDRILAEYLQTVESGKPISRDELFNRHPDLAADLREYFADEDRLGRAIARLKQPAQPETAVWREPDADQTTFAADSAHVVGPIIAAGRIFGEYQLLEEIGRGGMGVVFRARHISLDRTVALKMILSGELANETVIRRFRIEAETAARLEHPNIVPIYEVGQCQGVHFFTMALVDGGSLSSRLQHGPLPPREAAELVMTLARAVDFAHQHGVVHRDIKPANILLSFSRERQASANMAIAMPKITDFGLAKRMDRDAGTTVTGDIFGTVGYMAPEQAEGRVRQVGRCSDVYSLGAVLYAALTGRPPFLGENTFDTVLQMIEHEPVSPRVRNQAVPRSLETICLKCLEKDPQKRYQSAQELAEDLERFSRGEPIRARPPGLIGRLRRWSRKHPPLAVTWAALGGFYANHLILLALGARGKADTSHYSLAILIATWACGAGILEYLSTRLRGRAVGLVPFLWTAMDVGFFTTYLFLGGGPRSALIAGYLVLIAAAPLRGRVGLVWFTTALTVASYLSLAIYVGTHNDERAVTIYQGVVFIICLVMVALVQHLLLSRLPPDVSETSGSQSRTSVPV